MPTFLVESYEADGKAARERVLAAARQMRGVRHVRTVFVPEDEVVLHLFEAPSAAALGKAGRRASLPFDRIVEAIDGQIDHSGRELQ